MSNLLYSLKSKNLLQEKKILQLSQKKNEVLIANLFEILKFFQPPDRTPGQRPSKRVGSGLKQRPDNKVSLHELFDNTDNQDLQLNNTQLTLSSSNVAVELATILVEKERLVTLNNELESLVDNSNFQIKNI